MYQELVKVLNYQKKINETVKKYLKNKIFKKKSGQCVPVCCTLSNQKVNIIDLLNLNSIIIYLYTRNSLLKQFQSGNSLSAFITKCFLFLIYIAM